MAALPRYTKVTIRQPRALKAKVEKAAAMRGMTVTSFINGVLERVSDRTMERVRQRELSERDSRALIEMLSHPKGPNAALRRAAERYRERFGGR